MLIRSENLNARLFARLGLSSEDGQGLTEYIILLLLVSVISIAAVKGLGSTIKSKIQEAKNHINSDVSIGK
jgi:Flp pilus assembly pilin Flp